MKVLIKVFLFLPLPLPQYRGFQVFKYQPDAMMINDATTTN